MPYDLQVYSQRLRLLRRSDRRPTGASGNTWLPRELLVTVNSSDPRLNNPPLIPAQRVPSELSGSE